MARFEKGNTYGKGRPKGAPNKSTKEIRDAFKLFVEDNVGSFQEWIERVAENNPAKAIELTTNLAEYILPKLSRTEMKAEIKEKSVDLSKLDENIIRDLLSEDS